MLTVVSGEDAGRAGGAPDRSVIDEIVREGARAMLAAALRAEVAAYVEAHAGEVDEHGRRLVVRNGYAEPRQVLTSSGAVGVVAPRVDDKRVDEVTGERKRFSSAILLPWCRKSPKIDEVLPLLYLHGLSSGDFGPALAQFLGTSAGLSASVITRLTAQWQDEAKAFAARDLSGVDYVYVWADGIHVGVRLEQERLCLLVLIGVRADGRKELITLADGFRESEGSWADLLRDAARRGMRAPVLAVGDGALGFWAALGEVFPTTRAQRCWFHKTGNVLAALPKSAHPGAKKALAEIWGAEDADHARAAVKAFATLYGAKFAKAVAKAFTAARAWSASSAPQISARAFFAPGCADFGSAARTLPVLWNQQRWARVVGKTSPTASTGARIPRRAASRSRSAHEPSDSRNPSARVISSLRPSVRTPISTSRHNRSCSRRTPTWMPSAHMYT